MGKVYDDFSKRFVLSHARETSRKILSPRSADSRNGKLSVADEAQFGASAVRLKKYFFVPSSSLEALTTALHKTCMKPALYHSSPRKEMSIVPTSKYFSCVPCCKASSAATAEPRANLESCSLLLRFAHFFDALRADFRFKMLVLYDLSTSDINSVSRDEFRLLTLINL